MTANEREHFRLLADALDVQIEEVLSQGPASSYELRMAFNKLEEASMWMRRAIERWK